MKGPKQHHFVLYDLLVLKKSKCSLSSRPFRQTVCMTPLNRPPLILVRPLNITSSIASILARRQSHSLSLRSTLLVALVLPLARNAGVGT